MKIISKYKDYYDGVQAFGIDKTLVYNRTEEIVILETLPDYNNLLAIKGGGSIGIIVLEANKYGTEIAYIAGAIAGFIMGRKLLEEKIKKNL